MKSETSPFGGQLEEMDNLDRSRAGFVCELRFLVGMLSPRLVIVG